jgi:hypothetical protein
MFNIFRKKEKDFPFSEKELIFFRKLASSLPPKYSYIIPQINKEFIIGYKPNILGFKDSYTFLMNSNLEKKYIKVHLPNYFILKDIKLWNKKENKYFTIELDILSGILSGFKIENLDFENLDFDKTDSSAINEKHFENKNLMELFQNFNQDEKDILKDNMNHTYVINLAEGNYYFFANIGNGDVIVLDKLGDSYILTHDPSKIVKLFDKNSFLEKLKNKSLFSEALTIYNNVNT